MHLEPPHNRSNQEDDAIFMLGIGLILIVISVLFHTF
jgi:hypothetical protein